MMSVTVALTSAAVRERSESAAERDATIASRLANVAEETARPVSRLIIKLALQKPSMAYRAGSVVIR